MTPSAPRVTRRGKQPSCVERGHPIDVDARDLLAQRIAARGKVIPKLLKKLLSDPYYRKKPPKTAGREQYGKEFVAGLSGESADLVATATNGRVTITFAAPTGLAGGVFDVRLLKK